MVRVNDGKVVLLIGGKRVVYTIRDIDTVKVEPAGEE